MEPNKRVDWAALAAPFPSTDIEWRVSRAGWKGKEPWAIVLAYVTARAIQDRLDNVLGPENWKDQYTHLTGGVTCRLWIRLPGDREWIWKEDGSPESNIEAFKGGISGALKRVAVKVGVGRYLYKLTETFAQCATSKARGWNFAKHDGAPFYWETPNLMLLAPWAVPDEERATWDKYLAIDTKLKEADAKQHLENIVNKYRPDIQALAKDHPELAEALRATFAERKNAL